MIYYEKRLCNVMFLLAVCFITLTDLTFSSSPSGVRLLHKCALVESLMQTGCLATPNYEPSLTLNTHIVV